MEWVWRGGKVLRLPTSLDELGFPANQISSETVNNVDIHIVVIKLQPKHSLLIKGSIFNLSSLLLEHSSSLALHPCLKGFPPNQRSKIFTVTENSRELAFLCTGQGASCQLYLQYLFFPSVEKMMRMRLPVLCLGCTQWQRILDFCPQFKRRFKITGAHFVVINCHCKKGRWAWNKPCHLL